MGTNYYIRENECENCKRFEDIHLGKSSYGWQFSFNYNGGKFYKNIGQMKKWTKNKVIKDEYGDTITYNDFWTMVESKQTKENKNHAEYCHEKYPYLKDRELIIGGYSFSDCDFS